MKLQYLDKGEIPIIKNVNVVDEQGNEYEATYPKRAKGLVKSGRARFIGDNKICLVCPPSINLEENMSMTNENANNQNLSENNVKLDMQFILNNIVKIMNDIKYITDALENLTNMPVSQGPGDVAGQGKAQAIGKIVESREETNRQILKFLEYMYDDLKDKE